MKPDLGRLKALLGIEAGDASKDVTLAFILEDVEETILNYCNIAKIPDGLTNTAYRMAMELFRQGTLNASEDGSGEADASAGAVITSIRLGDTSIGLNPKSASASSSGGLTAADLLNNYVVKLNRYRRVNWQ